MHPLEHFQSIDTDRLVATGFSFGDFVSAVSGMPSSASMPCPISFGERNSAASIHQIGGDEGRRHRRPALHHQPGDAAVGERLQHSRQIEPAVLARRRETPRRPWP